MSRIIFKYCNPYANYLVINYVDNKSYCHSLRYCEGFTRHSNILNIDELIEDIEYATYCGVTIGDMDDFDLKEMDELKVKLDELSMPLNVRYQEIKLIIKLFDLRKKDKLTRDETEEEIKKIRSAIDLHLLKSEKFSIGTFENYSFGSYSLENKTVADTFKSCRFNFTTFKNCDMTNSIFKNCVLHKCVFINCDFESNTDIKGCKFISCNFDNCNFDYATLKDCDISEMYFKNTSIDKTLFCECEYRYAFLIEKYIEENTEVINTVNEYRKDKKLLQTNFFEKLSNCTCDDRKMSQEYIKYCMSKLELSDVISEVSDKTKEKDLEKYLNKLVDDLKKANLLRKGYVK